MDHDHFIGQVQHRARLASRGEAEAAVRATLETLAERLLDDSAENLASELPRELGHHLRVNAPKFERMSLKEFFDRVTEREKVDEPDAVFHARCVMEVLSEAVSPGAMEKLRQQLPEEFEPLVSAGSEGRMRTR
jgi:uncharacterized protein (DUF2267 family)